MLFGTLILTYGLFSQVYAEPAFSELGYCKTANFSKVGCFNEWTHHMKNMETMFNDRLIMKWSQKGFLKFSSTLICKCAAHALQQGKIYFSIRYFGICMASDDLGGLKNLLNDWAWHSNECMKGDGTYEPCDNTDPKECVGVDNMDFIYSFKEDPWSAWTPCGKTCGHAMQYRERLYPFPPQESKHCLLKDCPVNGGFGQWAKWKHCTKTCGDGKQVRDRKCDTPAQAYGGQPCVGSTEESKSCNTGECPAIMAHGSPALGPPMGAPPGEAPAEAVYSEWTRWNTCTKACGSGTHARSRKCLTEGVMNGESSCPDSLEEVKLCNTQSCTDACSTNNGGCTQRCTITNGKRTCKCDTGYILDNDGTTCQDVNECSLQHNPCNNEVCVNTPGSYKCVQPGLVNLEAVSGKCQFKPGGGKGGLQWYVGETDSKEKCVEECLERKKQMPHINGVRVYSIMKPGCWCEIGMKKWTTNKKKEEFKTCVLDFLHPCGALNGGCNQKCDKTKGVYTCSCYTGYELTSGGKKCHDVNECVVENGNCEHKCINTEGSYTCACNKGYLLESNGRGCKVDVWEKRELKERIYNVRKEMNSTLASRHI